MALKDLFKGGLDESSAKVLKQIDLFKDLSTYEIERARFGCDDHRLSAASDGERPETVGIAHRI